MIRRPPRSTLKESSAASDVYKRQAPSTPGVDAFITPAPGTPGLSKLRLSSKTPSAGVDTGTDRNILRCSKGIHLKDPWCAMVLSGKKTWDIRGFKKTPECPARYNIIRKKVGIVGHVEIASFMEINAADFDQNFDKHRVHRDHTYIYTYIQTRSCVGCPWSVRRESLTESNGADDVWGRESDG